MFEEDYDNYGNAMGDLIDALEDAPLHSQPVDREVDSDGTEIILTNGNK